MKLLLRLFSALMPWLASLKPEAGEKPGGLRLFLACAISGIGILFCLLLMLSLFFPGIVSMPDFSWLMEMLKEEGL